MHTNSRSVATGTAVYATNHSKAGKWLFFQCRQDLPTFQHFPPKGIINL